MRTDGGTVVAAQEGFEDPSTIPPHLPGALAGRLH